MKEKIYKKELGDHSSSHLFIFFHDFWDYHKSYLSLGNYINEITKNKVSTTLFDVPGFGLSGGTRGHLDDLDEFCLEISNYIDQQPNKKIILGGYGFGALLALKVYFKFGNRFSKNVEGLFLCNPFFSFKEYFTKGFKDSAYILNGPLGKLKVPYTNAEKLFTPQMKEDPLNCKKISFRLFGLVNLDGPIALSWGSLVDKSIMVMTGGASSFYSLEDTRKFTQSIDSKYKTIIEYQDLGHWLFQSEQSEDIMASIGKWFKEVIK